MRSIKTEYILTCAKVSGISIVALMVMSVSSMFLYWHMSDVTQKQLPFTLELNKLSANVTESLDALNNWVLLGNKANVKKRQALWNKRIFPSLELIDSHIELSESSEQKQQFADLNKALNALYISQWWVEDVTQYIGNQPALVTYKRDLLPVYYRIQSALSGIVETKGANTPTSELKLTVSNTHLLLTETIYQISEIMLTGEMAYLKRFKNGASKVSQHIKILKNEKSLTPDAAILVTWIERQYQVYIKLANQVTLARQTTDWNRAINVISTETEPLTAQVKSSLLKIQDTHIRKLKADTLRVENATFFAFLLALFLLLMTMTTAILLTGGNARKIVKQVVELRTAAIDLAQGRQTMIEVEFDNELGDLAKVFNQMQRIILRRRKKYVNERERLNEVVRIITHDMKSPLINITGHSEIIHDELLEAFEEPSNLAKNIHEIESSLQYVKLSTQRIDELIKGILEFSATVHKEIKLTRVQLRSCIAELLELNSARLKDVKINLGNIPSEVFSDLFAFKFIFSTLLDNAIKYKSIDRDLELDIYVKLDLKDESWTLAVKDNGIGISDSQRPSVFKMFSRNKSHVDGYGIGLSCAKTLAQRLNGDICFENNSDEIGTTFFVKLNYYNEATLKTF
jgi:signal transduction histidine kinase